MGVLLISVLEHEQSRMEALRELFRTLDELVTLCGAVGLRLEKAVSGKSKESIPDLQRQLDERQLAVTNFYKVCR